MGGGYGGPPPAGGGSGKPNVALLAVLGVLIAAVIGGGIFLLTSGDDDDDSTDLTDQQQEDSDLDLPELDEDTPDTTGDDTTDGSDSTGGEFDLSEISGMSDAEDVITSFIAHEQSMDCDAMSTLLSSTYQEQYDSQEAFITDCEETYGAFGEIVVENVTVTSVTDSTIEIASDQVIDGSPHASTYTMILEEGTWWIDDWE